MNHLHQTRRALQAGLGFALVAAFAMMNGCTAVERTDDPGQLESTGEAQEAMFSPGFYACDSNTTGPSTLIVKVGPSGLLCTKLPARLPGASQAFCFEGLCPKCKQLAKDNNCELTE